MKGSPVQVRFSAFNGSIVWQGTVKEKASAMDASFL